ncbi:hypothetical protein FACS189413_08020 [Bacteroidia bacterium]|nr:hypothetical protein FACS189413_08020 [Bacteroidia bacterium]
MKKFLCIVYLFVSAVNAFAQTGAEFWFAAPQLITDGSSSRNRVRDLTFVAYSEAVAVTVEMPANPGFTPVKVNIPANTMHTLHLESYSNIMLTQPANAVVNTGIKITSTGKISCYYAITQADSEIYTLKGRNGLGTEFLVPSQFTRANSGNTAHTVEIVATEDNTTVEILPSRACIGHAANTLFSITLGKGQAYCLKAASNSAGSQLRNTVITADKPIAVNTSDDMVNGGGGDLDLIGEQLVPTALCGDKYIAVKNSNGNVEQINIFPLEDNTVIRINGVALPAMNKGSEYQTAPAANVTLITSDNGKPFVAFQVTSNGNELGGTMLPFISCTGSREVAYSPILTQMPTVVVLAKTSDIGAFNVNGMGNVFLPVARFSPLPDDPDWSYSLGSLPSINGVVRIENSQGYFHFGVYDYTSGTCSYGYFSNYNLISLAGNTGKAYYRTGETINMVLADTTGLENFFWKGAGGFTSNVSSPQIENCTQSNAGMYVVTASHEDGCPIEPDTFYVHVFPEAKAQEHTICYGNNITLSAPGSEPFLWNNGETTKTITVTPNATTGYTATSMQAGFDDLKFFALTDTYRVVVLDSLKPNISGDHFICHGNAVLSVSENYESYLWSTGETTQSINVTQAGIYSVNVADGDCRGSGIFSVNPAPEINITVNNKIALCPGEANFEIEYQSITGEIGSFDIDFENAELQDKTGEQLTNDKIMVEIPQNTRPDVYKATLTVYEKNCGESQTIPLEMMVKYPSDIIAQRWNDILGVMNTQYNDGYNFTAFQWYKNGIEMAGETSSYIYRETEFSTADTYSVLLTNSAGKQIFTCDFSPEHLAAGSVQTLVQPLQTINLNANGTASFYDMVGTVYSIQNTLDNQIVAPEKQGIYFLKFNGKIIKIVVR